MYKHEINISIITIAPVVTKTTDNVLSLFRRLGDVDDSAASGDLGDQEPDLSAGVTHPAQHPPAITSISRESNKFISSCQVPH